LALQALGSGTVATSLVTESGTLGLSTPVGALLFGVGLLKISAGALEVRESYHCPSTARFGLAEA